MPSTTTPKILSFRTVVQSLLGSTHRFGFLGVHGVQLAPGATYTEPGNLVQSLAEEAKSGQFRRFEAFEKAVDGFTDQFGVYHAPSLAILELPTPVLFDTTTHLPMRLTLINGTLGVAPLDYGVQALTGQFYPISGGFKAVTFASLVFDQPVAGFSIAKVAMTRGGSGVTLTGASVSTKDNLTWDLKIPTALTKVAGNYVLTVAHTSSGITGPANNVLSADVVATWTKTLLTGSFATIAGGTTAVASAVLTFSSAVTGFAVGKLALTLGGTPVTPLTGVTVTSLDNGITWNVAGLAASTAANGTYILKVTAASSGIIDSDGNVLSADVSATWVKS